MGKKTYRVAFKFYQWDTVRYINVEANNKADAYDRAVWENETIERDYVKQNPAPIILFLVLSIVNVIILVANLYFENKAVTAVVSTISAIAIIIVSIVYYRKYYNSK